MLFTMMQWRLHAELQMGSVKTSFYVTTGLEFVDRNIVIDAGADFFQFKPFSNGVRSLIIEMIQLSDSRI